MTQEHKPGISVHGERANFTGLALACIEAHLCNQIIVGERRDLRKLLRRTAL